MVRRSKVRSGVGLVSANMGVTQAGSNAPNSGHHHLLIDVDEPPRSKGAYSTGQDPSSFRRGPD